jgi:hypothetical protein
MSDPKKKDHAKAPVPALVADEPPAPSAPRASEPTLAEAAPPPVAPDPTPPPVIRVTTAPNGTVTNEIGGS